MRARLCPLTSPGYSHPATAAALEPHRRGHEVAFCSGAAALAPAAAAGLDVRPGAAESAFDVSRWLQAGEVRYRTVLEAARGPRGRRGHLRAVPGRAARRHGAGPDRSAAYAHPGRTFGGSALRPWIERAFTGTGRRAVVELGRTEEHRPAPGADVPAVRHRWTGPLLDRVDLVAVDGTSAPVPGALLHDRPLLRPDGGEQPVVGGAALAAGVAAESTESTEPTEPTEPTADPGPFARVLGDHAPRSRVRRPGESLRQAKSAALAAQAVEEASR
ncbi:hypothetical protein [Kitasatospora phosalacinea]|uniref:hypothetical protein n=1 Tax=Kitasatospora phosalacinea TaxID=2065 RepID=UPI0005261E65|nr:hypothetical protein [Kitasatospora phosalacinea]